ncbi:WD repeat-containing protein 3 [Anthonomus grandis grandis]|uniref:WD repeat-containing protein 3 n=1 Tax=Anthonomus grandis grandis TaxID=2921223 RepID=UPI00216502D0|nr:WD repeat-containing protein 3 [Anthonomus grandis grandis]
MGLTKDYLRYIPAGTFNIISSQNCNAVFVTLQGQIGRFVAVGACEHIIIWDLRLGEKAQLLPGEHATVTSICASPNNRHLAAGYSDGSVQIYDLKSAEVISIFSGHKSEVTTLAYDSYGHKLASGSKDTDIIVWDTVAETGLYRFSGHKGPITKVAFMSKENVLVSAAKDAFVKFWDLSTQHCFKTLTEHQTEVWGFCLIKDDQYLVTGCGDAELRVFKLTLRDLDTENVNPVEHLSATLELATLDEGDDTTHPLQCLKIGSLLRPGKGRVVTLTSDANCQIIGVHGTDQQIELFYFCSEDEAQNRLKKRLKKEKKKEKKDEAMETEEHLAKSGGGETFQLSLRDEVKRLNPIKLTSKPKSVDLLLGNGGELRVAVNFSDNCVRLFNMQTSLKETEATCLRSILSQGHHSDVRAVAFSSDNLAIVSGSTESIKMWNRPSQTCLRTVETRAVLSIIFAPGDRHVLAGLKDGTLVIIDIAAGDILEEIPAHSKDLRALSLTPDLRGCITGGGDKTVKFWQFELIVDEKSQTKVKVLSLIHNRTLKLEDSVMCVKISPNSKYIAVALLDSTVKIFFVDTFKFYLSLYGHKLPVQCMDISSDSTLIATGSGDRNIKIWGMDFGDCHKSIFAHDDTVTGLQFVPKTHYLFTCGKDGKVKQWDADKYNKIVTLQGHSGEAYGLSVSPNGLFVVSSGSDRVLRLYERSDQIVVLQDEEEEEREKAEELATGEQTVVPGQPGINLPSKRTVGSEMAAESILECLEINEKYQEQLAEFDALQAASTQALVPPAPPLLMQALNVATPQDFLLETIKRIRASDLEEGLLILPFHAVCEILTALPNLIERGDCTELGCKVAMFLLRLHHAPIVANKLLLDTLQKLQKVMQEKVTEMRDLVGYNYFGLQFLQREIEVKEGVQLFRDATIERKKGEKRRKKRDKLKRSILVLNT